MVASPSGDHGSGVLPPAGFGRVAAAADLHQVPRGLRRYLVVVGRRPGSGTRRRAAAASRAAAVAGGSVSKSQRRSNVQRDVGGGRAGDPGVARRGTPAATASFETCSGGRHAAAVVAGGVEPVAVHVDAADVADHPVAQRVRRAAHDLELLVPAAHSVDEVRRVDRRAGWTLRAALSTNRPGCRARSAIPARIPLTISAKSRCRRSLLQLLQDRARRRAAERSAPPARTERHQRQKAAVVDVQHVEHRRARARASTPAVSRITASRSIVVGRRVGPE